MKNLEMIAFCFVISCTSFVTWRYFCEKCRTTHQQSGDCIVFDSYGNNAKVINYITSLTKDELRYCHPLDRADEVIHDFRYILELDYQHCHTVLDQKHVQRIYEFLDNLDRRIIDYRRPNNGPVIAWKEIFEDSDEFIPTSSDNSDNQYKTIPRRYNPFEAIETL